MSSTSQITTFSDAYTDLINRVRQTTGVTATDTLAKRYINIALQDIHLGFDYRFPWAERQATVRTQASYSTGTVTATRGSATITGVGTAWNTNNDFSIKNMRAGGKIVFAGARQPYTISAVASDTSATLTTAFTETTVSAGTYVYFEDEYALASDFLRPVDMQRFSDPMEIWILDRNKFRQRYPTNTTLGRIRDAVIMDSAPSGNTTPVRKVRFGPAPNIFQLVPYAYLTANLATSSVGVAQTGMSADSDEPIIPLRYRHALVYHALSHWYRDRKDDSREVSAKQEYTDIMTRMAMDTETGAQRPNLRPDVRHYKRNARNPYSGSRRFDRGGFDDMGE